jgi:hypothetical protein
VDSGVCFISRRYIFFENFLTSKAMLRQNKYRRETNKSSLEVTSQTALYLERGAFPAKKALTILLFILLFLHCPYLSNV